jgi:hypothetical protein
MNKELQELRKKNFEQLNAELVIQLIQEFYQVLLQAIRLIKQLL